MITQILTNSNPYPSRLGINQLLQVTGTNTFSFEDTNDICYCAIECEYREPVFAEVGGEDYKNDHSSFLFRKVDTNDIISFELFKNGVKVADLNNNTLGEYYSSFATQPLQTGFIIDWEKVLPVHGAGKYRFKAPQTILGESNTFESRIFELKPYSDRSADKTVRIKGIQTGDIEGSRFVFRDLLPDGWPFYVRVRGYFQEVEPELTKGFLKDSERVIAQIQDEIVKKYTLDIYQAPKSVLNLFLNGEISLANNIFVTDYNIFNTEILRNVEVDNQNIGYEPNKNQRKQDMLLEFNARKQNLVTRNY
jgi:hypothetical protein